MGKSIKQSFVPHAMLLMVITCVIASLATVKQPDAVTLVNINNPQPTNITQQETDIKEYTAK